jgi:hypothetical protein
VSKVERESAKRAKIKGKARAEMREAHVTARDAAKAESAAALSRARERARTAESESTARGRKLAAAGRALDASDRLKDDLAAAQNESEELREQVDELLEQVGRAVTDGVPDLASVGKRANPVIRKIAMHMLAKKTPPAAVVHNIAPVLKYCRPSLLENAHLPEANFIRTVRREMSRIAKTLAASRASCEGTFASAHTDGTALDKQQTVTIGTVTRDGERIVLDAARTTVGQTAELEAGSFAESFADCAGMLDEWDKEAEAAGVSSEARAATIGDSRRVGLHQLGGGCAMETDSCNQALKLSGIVQANVKEAVKQQLRDEGKLGAMSAEQVDEACAVYGITCHHHLRNILVARGARASTARLREHLEAELKSIPPEKRVVADADALVRSIWKEFADSHRTYAKGQASPCLGHATPTPSPRSPPASPQPRVVAIVALVHTRRRSTTPCWCHAERSAACGPRRFAPRPPLPPRRRARAPRLPSLHLTHVLVRRATNSTRGSFVCTSVSSTWRPPAATAATVTTSARRR